ncbi:major facilitator superfamily domain-containing protein [Gloeopeniophorella convolvens]|nr:major facilitator superfamily domain-containing protein [Gloeopeniophorella convolvens]
MSVKSSVDTYVGNLALPKEPDLASKEAQLVLPPPFPEGGLKAWLTVVGGSAAIFCTFGAVQSFGIYQDYYTRVSLSEHSPSQISWIGSFQLFLLFVLGLPAGDMFDGGYFHHLVAVGSLFYLFALFMLSLTKPHEYYQTFLSQGLGMGIGMGLLMLPSLSVAAHYFQKRRSIAMGCVIAGASLGGVVWPIMLNHLIDKSGGFPWAVRASGFVALFLLIAANIVMRTRLPSRKQRPNAKRPDFRQLLTDVPYWICIAGAFLIFWGLFFPFFYLQLFSVLHHVPRSIALYAIPIMNGSSFFGRTIPMFAADRYGKFNVVIPMTTISGALIFAMLGVKTTGTMIVFAILYGFFSGAFLALMAPVFTTFAKSLNEVGIRIGVSMFVLSFSLLTGNPIAGSLLKPPSYEWDRPIIFAAVMVLAGCVLLTISRHMVVKAKGTQWV